MSADRPTRDQAWALLCELNETERARRHALAVEATLRHFAKEQGADEEEWGIVGLIHDLDYERFPEHHCTKTAEILRARSWPEAWIRAAVSHGFGVCSEVEPQSALEKTLFAVDELTGLVAACALVRPSKSILDLEVKSVRKKWKEKQFAAGVDRALIERGAKMLGVEVDALIAKVITAMRPRARELGLAGTAPPQV
jgi:putative nucleotidyltransferase with HDIG domain